VRVTAHDQTSTATQTQTSVNPGEVDKIGC
jgi:hypothetical protein